jgi:putative ABC transport system ATP-binding protein
MEREKLIRAEGLRKIYSQGMPDEVTALVDAAVTVERGEVVAFKGPSGSGKTTLLSLVGCMSRPTAGRIAVQGRDVAKLPERFLTAVRRRTFGFIFQQFNLVRDTTVEENVALPLYPLDTALSEVRDRVRRELDRFGLGPRRHLKVSKLSGGEQQRVAIARALVNEPEIVIADEPTAHLDRALATELMRFLGELVAEGKTVLVATHDPFVHEHSMVTRTVEMSGGKITGINPP